jgi:predicted amidohydrolase YtcJ
MDDPGDTTDSAWLLRDVELAGARCDVRLRAGRILAIGAGFPDAPGERVHDGRGGALLPGLHDHHLHLLALAAALDSVRCGPPDVVHASGLAAALARAARGADPARGLRGVGYHESVAGDLDRHALDRLGPAVPIRIQHRSGVRWILNSLALSRLGSIDPADRPPGLELDAAGEPTGRIDRADAWLRGRLGEAAPPDLAPVGARLTRFGVTGICDATPGNDADVLGILRAARARGALSQRLLVMGRPDLPPTGPDDGIRRGALKVMLDENALPDHAALVARIAASHRAGRGVAFHCVTRAELVFAASALEEAGCTPWDRIEHASVAPPDCVAWLARMPLAVVTQPNFLRERGDAYLASVPAADRPWLYRGRGFRDAGIPLAAGTDAPFGHDDPWRAMRAAVDRRAASGAVLAAAEALTPEEALALFTTPLESPGRPVRRLAAGAVADLCLLDRPWSSARERLSADDVAATFVAGRRIGSAGDADAGRLPPPPD